MCSLGASIFLYACEPWTFTAELQRRIRAMEMKCCCKILFISYTCYQRGHLCQDPAGNRTTRRPDHRKETQTEVVWTCLPFIRSGQDHMGRHSEKDKADRRRSGKTTSGNGQAWSLPSPRGQWRTGENGGNWLQNHLWCTNDLRG